MKTNRTELAFILDRSGSMCGLEADTIGGYNAMLEKQKKEAGEAIVTTVLFDDQYELLHDRIDLRGIAPITDREYYVRGSTALLDAIGKTIQKIANIQKRTAPEFRAERVWFVITTDGHENASREYRYSKGKALLERQKKQYGWEFLFLGANIDAIATAQRFGIEADRAVDYHADGEGTQLNYQVLSETVSCVRAGVPIKENWKQRIEENFRSQKRK